jgi:RND family efflux transporter MFP subunit
MKKVSVLVASVTLVFLAACGGGNSLEAKKEKLEKLKAQQAEIASEITSLQEEIAKSGDTAVAENTHAKIVVLTPVSKQTFVHAIDVQGRVDGDENITYGAKVPAAVSRIYVKAGDRVRAGQVMAELDNANVKANIEALKKTYELASTVYEKRKALWDQKVGSEIEYIQAKNNKETLEKQIAAAKEGLDMYSIKADFDGVVDLVNMKVGQQVAPGTGITVVNPSALKIKADLSESYASQVKAGNSVMVRFIDINKNMNAKVTYASRSINVATRTFNVEIGLPSDAELHPNMVAELKIVDYEKPNSLVVPINVIQDLDGQKVVFIAVKKGNEYVAKKAVVIVGKQYETTAEILSGLNEGDQLITTGFQDLTEDQVVKF